MNNSRERHIRQIVESANKDKTAQMRERRVVGVGNEKTVANKSSVKTSTSRASAKMAEEKPLKRVVRPQEGAVRASSARGKSSSRGNEGAKGESRGAREFGSQGSVVRKTQPTTETRNAPKPVAKPKQSEVRKSEDKQNAKVWIAIAFIFLAGLVMLSCLSYFKYWKQDANLAEWGQLFISKSGSALNWCGKLGAIIGELFVGRWFGVFGLLIAVALLLIAVRLFNIRGLRMRRSLRGVLVIMLVGSVCLGHFLGVNHEVFGSGWGGAMGIEVAQWLQGVLGEQGTSLLLVLAGIAVFYFVNAGWCVRWYKKIDAIISRYSQYRKLRNEAIRLKNEKLAHENSVKRAELAQMKAARAAEMRASTATIETVGEAVGTTAKADATTSTVVGENESNVVAEVAPTPIADETDSSQAMVSSSRLATEIKQEMKAALANVRRFDETVALDNGQIASVLGYNDDGSFSYLYLDCEELKNTIQPTPQKTVEPLDALSGTLAETIAEPEEDDFDKLYSMVKNEVASAVASAIATSPQTANAQAVAPIDDMRDENPSPITAGAQTQSVATPSGGVDFKQNVKVISGNENEPALVVEMARGDLQVEDSEINMVELYDPTLELRNYKKPPVELLLDHKKEVIVTDEELLENKQRIVYTLETFGIKIDTIEAVVGPTVTLYEIIPAPGVRISKIKNLEDDIALSLAALGIRIIAPIPGKGTIGIEVPNKDKEVVSMYSVIKSAKFQDSKFDLPVAIGKTIQNETFVFDLAKMPHLLVAGATGQGKSVGLNAIITSLLYKKHPSELKFVLVDPKKVELSVYSKLEKHFLAKIPDADEAIITDTQKVIFTLNSICIEMDARYDLLKDASVRNLKEYNEKFIRRRLNPLKGHRFLPYFVVVIDEFADLIMTAGREVETPIARIAQLARAVGIHLIIATQRPTTNIITGVIKANFPARIAFKVTSQIDSRTILDQSGANQLIGRGDMLISSGSELTRVQCAFVDTPEVEMIVEHIGKQQGYAGAYELPDYQPEGAENNSRREDDGKRDPLFVEVARYVVDNQSGSASTIQRKFSIGFNRAGRIVDQLEAAGIVGRQEGSKPRQVLISDPVTLENILDR